MESTHLTGKGVGVAVLDTGIYPHMDFGSRISGFYDFLSHQKRPYDDNGHGTHVAGILAGDGQASGGKYTGTAPGASIVALKVLDRMGNGSRDTLLKAFFWLEKYGREYGIRIVNISVGTTCSSKNQDDRLLKGVDALWDQGFVIVAAAGNRGPCPGSITAPGCSRKVITVGSSDMINGKEAVSGRGPTFECVFKPDIVAPGYRITSCSSASVTGYGIKSGTSMSTPLVSGAIALLLEKYPEMTNREIKMRLKECADDMGLSKNQQGWGKFNRKRFLSI